MTAGDPPLIIAFVHGTGTFGLWSVQHPFAESIVLCAYTLRDGSSADL